MTSHRRGQLSATCGALCVLQLVGVRCLQVTLPSPGKGRRQRGHETPPTFPACAETCIPAPNNSCLITGCFLLTQNLCSKLPEVQLPAILTLPGSFPPVVSFFTFPLNQTMYFTSYIIAVVRSDLQSFIPFIKPEVDSSPSILRVKRPSCRLLLGSWAETYKG